MRRSALDIGEREGGRDTKGVARLYFFLPWSSTHSIVARSACTATSGCQRPHARRRRESNTRECPFEPTASVLVNGRLPRGRRLVDAKATSSTTTRPFSSWAFGSFRGVAKASVSFCTAPLCHTQAVRVVRLPRARFAPHPHNSHVRRSHAWTVASKEQGYFRCASFDVVGAAIAVSRTWGALPKRRWTR